ncbi:hypothetical protein DE146DRAFT_132725 [Phaeosphaeria sp. MPI-PUGE-AT-0046c]|nr:hypothetical protein DE146DRAFT_132725 [Phaeosphaeria sp. MPI-PUGE-AT-0046c]
MQPWEELAKHPQPATKTLLLDYVSSNPFVSFFRSLKHRHWPVTSVLIGSFLIKGLIVVSTGLFVLHPIVRPRDVTMDMTETFEFPPFNATDVDDSAGLMYAGPLLNEIAYLPGTNAEYAAALFNSSHPVNGTQNMTTTSTTFIADLSCEVATVEPIVKTWCPASTSCASLYLTMDVHNDNCRMSAWPKNNMTLRVQNNGLQWGQWFGGVYTGSCDGKDSELDRERLVIVTLYKEPGVISRNATNTTFTNTTAVFCKPTYKLQRSTVTLDQSGAIERVEPGALLDQPAALTPFMIAEAVRATISQVDVSNIQQSVARDYGIDRKQFGVSDVFLNFILQANPSKKIADLSDVKALGPAAQTVFRSVAVQVVKRYFLVPSNATVAEQISGEVMYSQQRLFARIPTLRVMESFLCLLIVVGLFLGTRPSRHTTPQDPASIARLGAMISQSKNFNQVMSSAGFLSLENLKSLLPGRYHGQYYKDTYATTPRAPLFAIESHDTGSQDIVPADGKYWRPVSMSWFSRSALLVVPLIIIIVLEVTYRQSQRDDGLLVVASNKITDYGSQFVPALVMVLTKLMFSAADFDLRIMDPYVQLKRGYASAKSSVLNKTIYTWKADAFWNAFVHKRIAVGMSTFSVVIASFLTVAASGLFTTVSISHQRSTSVMRMNSFYDPSNMTSNLNGTFNYTTSIAARLVVYDRMTSPPWTSGSYILPTLSLLNSTSGAEVNDTAALIALALPVRRGALTCQLIPRSDIELNYTRWDSANKEAGGFNNGVIVRWPMLDDYPCTTMASYNKPSEQITGVTDGPFGEWTNFDPSSAVGKNYTSPCPTSYGIYGTWEGRRAKELNVILCWSSVQELNGTARFEMPAWKLQSLSVDEITVKNVSTRFDTQLNLGTAVFLGSKGNISTSLDAVFTGFLRNSTTNSLDTDLLSYDNFDKFYERIQGIYGAATAQIMNREGRYTNLTSTRTTFPATATDLSTSRLKQNLVSTRILQSLLIAMLLCALIALLTSNPKNVLPKNPCSIAAQASLVAGSSMVADLPAHAQWMNDREFVQLFEGKRYAMGWSEEGYEQGRFGVDVDLAPKQRRKGGWWNWR